MRRISMWAAVRPRAALAVWLAAVLVLAGLGHGVERHLTAAGLHVDGSRSAAAGALSAEHFADATTLPVLLTGSSREVRSAGRRVARRLDALPGADVLSPWNAPAQRDLLRPRADRLLLLVSLRGSREDAVRRTALRVRDVARSAAGPVAVHVTGVPLVADDLRTASVSAASRAERLALPLLLLLLLLVFRSLPAALLPVALGGATVLASGGAVRLLTEVVDVDGFATGLASMMGLALATDYSLLVVSRYRDERAAGAAPEAALATATRASGHVVALAGAAVVAAMLLAAMLAAGDAIPSAALGVAAAAVLAMVGAGLALPAAVALWGERMLGGGSGARRSVAALLPAAVLRRPVAAGGAATLVLLGLALPALAQDASVPDVGQLPRSSAARADYEAISRAVGPGWGAGYEVVGVARTGTMTTAGRLRALARLQERIARDPEVAAVLGPAGLARRAAVLRRSGRNLLHAQADLRSGAARQAAELRRLRRDVGRASGGAGALDGSLAGASRSAASLADGGSRLGQGAGRLSAGVHAAAGGAADLDAAVRAATGRAGAVAAGVHAAHATSTELTRRIQGVGSAAAQVRPVLGRLADHQATSRTTVMAARTDAAAQRSAALAQVRTARLALLSGRQSAQTLAALAALQKAQSALDADPTASLEGVAASLDADAGSAGRLAEAVAGVSFHDLAVQARSLSHLLAAADSRQGEINAAVSRLTRSVGSLRGALDRLGGGTQQLSGGLATLQRGLSDLQRGAAAGRSRTSELTAGLARARTALAGAQPQGAAGSGATAPSARAAIDSGYFVLAALDAGGAGAQSGLDVDRGGRAARLLVIPRHGTSDPRTAALARRLDAEAQRFAAANGLDAAVGGPAAELADYGHATTSRLLPIVLALSLATALLLAFVLRSIGVAVIGVGLNLLGVGATLGLLDRLFPGGVDATALTAVFAVMFALATDYQVFVVTRIREKLERGAPVERAVADGLARTARVVTGAALAMGAVFLAFGTADVAALRQFGIGLAIAVAIDATIIRLVLLPAALALAGERAWWPGPPPVGRTRIAPLCSSSLTASGSSTASRATTSTSMSSAMS